MIKERDLGLGLTPGNDWLRAFGLICRPMPGIADWPTGQASSDLIGA